LDSLPEVFVSGGEGLRQKGKAAMNRRTPKGAITAVDCLGVTSRACNLPR
jgi:hypothetical protein